MSFTILHTESSEGWGGQENRTLLESLGLRKRGARVIILCQPGSILGKRAVAEGIEVRTCRMRKSYDIFAIKYILDLIKAENVNIVSTHSGRDSLLAGIAGRLSRRKPLIVRTRHIALPITSKLTYSLLPHKVVTTSEYVRHYLISAGVSSTNILAIPSGIDVDQFNSNKTVETLRTELGLHAEIPVIGTIAILRYKKGYHILLDAIPQVLEKVPDAVFIFAGDGPQKENISNRIKSLGLESKIFMLGMRKDIPNILKSIDLFVLPTLQESLPQSLLQAMAMGKPVVGTKVGGIGEVLKDGINGYLVEPGNPSALAEALIKLLRDKDKARIMGMEGEKIVRQNYTVEKMCENLYTFYFSMLKDQPLRSREK